MFRYVIFAALLLPGTALAQDGAGDAGDGKPERVRSVVLHGDEQCPKPSQEGEVVVCARGGESPYRIPSDMRQPVERPDATSWAVHVDDMMAINRVGMPNSCSPVGSGGQSGCTMQMLQQWRAERAAQQRRDAVIP